MAQTRAIATNTAAIFIGKALGLVIGIIRLNYIATYLGVSSFGILNFAAYFVALFSILADLGLPNILTRDIARDRSKTLSLICNGLIFKVFLVFSTILSISIASLFSRFEKETLQAVVLTMVAFGFNSFSVVFTSAFQAHQRMKLYSIAVLLNDIVNSLAVIFLISSFPSINLVLFVSVAASVLNLLVLFFLSGKVFGHLRFSFDRTLLKYFFSEGYPLALSAVGITINLYIGSIVLKYYCGDSEVGLYSAAFKLFSIMMLLPASFTQVIYPVLSGFFSTAKEKVPKAFNDSLRVMAILSVPLAAGTILLSSQIILLIYTRDFSASAISLAILVGSSSVGYLNWVVSSLLVAVNRQKFTMLSTLSVALIAVGLSFLIIPNNGHVAAAAITAGCDLVLFLMFFLYLYRTEYKINLIATLLKPLSASLIMIGCIIPLKDQNVFIVVLCGVCVYTIVMFVLKGFGEQEKQLFSMIFKNNQ
jgi:O-antigen/teichoic acid export membrane protein